MMLPVTMMPVAAPVIVAVREAAGERRRVDVDAGIAVAVVVETAGEGSGVNSHDCLPGQRSDVKSHYKLLQRVPGRVNRDSQNGPEERV